MWTWGGNAAGQLGYGTSDSACNPTPRLVEALKGRKLVGVAGAKHHTGGLEGPDLEAPRGKGLTGKGLGFWASC